MKQQEFRLGTDVQEEAEIPRRFWTFSHPHYFGSKRAMQVCENYIDRAKENYKSGMGLFFRGDSDSGKTFLMTYVLNAILASGEYNVLYTTLDKLTESMMRPERFEKFNIEFLDRHFLAIDNVDTFNEGTRAALKRVIEARRDNQMPFLIATSLPVVDDGSDVFALQFKDIAPKIENLTETVNCSVDPSKLERYYSKLRKHQTPED